MRSIDDLFDTSHEQLAKVVHGYEGKIAHAGLDENYLNIKRGAGGNGALVSFVVFCCIYHTIATPSSVPPVLHHPF